MKKNIQFRPSAGKTKTVRIDQAVVTRALRAVQKDGGRQVLADADCAGLRLTVGRLGAVWSYAFRPRGQRQDGSRWPQRTLRLGDVTVTTPAEARVEAARVKQAVAQGRDPQAEARDAARQAAMRQTLGELAGEYGDALPKTKHGVTERSQLALGLSDMQAGDLEPADLSVRDVRALVSRHKARPATARARYGALSRFLDNLVADEIIAVNPCASLGKKHRPAPPPPKRLSLNAAGLQAIWVAAENMGPVKCAYLRCALLLPLRAGELAELTQSNIDTQRWAITLSHLETKNGDPFILPIPPEAQSILLERIGAADPKGRLFPLNSAGGLMQSWTSFSKRIRRLSGVPDFKLHDIRRLFVSELAEQNIGDTDVTDGLLNHRQSGSRSGVKGAYQQSRQWPQKVAVMREWGRLVAYAVAQGNWPVAEAEVVTFPSTGASR